MELSQQNRSIIPQNDKERLYKLYLYDILDTPAEAVFDNIATLAAQVFGTPSAFISFVDEERVFFKSNLSTLEGSEVPRNESLCSIAILDEEQVTVYTDTHQKPELLSNPNVVCEGGIRFYAGAPLKTTEGYQLGTVCVTDSRPRSATPEQLAMLKTLSTLIMNELEQRLSAKRAIQTQTDLMNITIHDLKGPANNILLLTEYLDDTQGENGLQKQLKEKLKLSATDIIDKLDNLLRASQVESEELVLNLECINIAEILDTVVKNAELQATNKNQHIIKAYPQVMIARADTLRIKEVFENLLSNAIKYSYHDSIITITAREKDATILVSFKDQGQGLNSADLDKLFIKFARLSAQPTAKESSNRLGLFIVKTLIDLHNGNVWAESEGKNKGATFYVSLPIN